MQIALGSLCSADEQQEDKVVIREVEWGRRGGKVRKARQSVGERNVNKVSDIECGFWFVVAYSVLYRREIEGKP